MGFLIPIGFDDNKYKYITLVLMIVFEILMLLRIKFNNRKLQIILFVPIVLLFLVYLYYFFISCHVETKDYLKKELGLDPNKLSVNNINYESFSGSEWVTVTYGYRHVTMIYHIDSNRIVYISLWHNNLLGWQHEIYDNADNASLFGSKDKYLLNKKIEKNLSNIILKYTKDFKIYSNQEKSYSKYPIYLFNYKIPIFLEDKKMMKSLIEDVKKYEKNNHFKSEINLYFFDKQLYDINYNDDSFDDPKMIYYNFVSLPDFDEKLINDESLYKLDSNNNYRFLGIFYHYKIERQSFSTVCEFNVFGQLDYENTYKE